MLPLLIFALESWFLWGLIYCTNFSPRKQGESYLFWFVVIELIHYQIGNFRILPKWNFRKSNLELATPIRFSLKVCVILGFFEILVRGKGRIIRSIYQFACVNWYWYILTEIVFCWPLVSFLCSCVAFLTLQIIICLCQ